MARISILTLNMQNGQIWNAASPDEAPMNLPMTMAFIRQSNPDIFFLQELELAESGFIDRTRHPNYDYLRTAFPAYHSTFAFPANTVPHLPFGIGLAIFSRFPLSDCFHLVLPSADMEFEFKGSYWKPAERSLIGGFINLDNTRIQLLNTHLQAYFMCDSTSNRYPQQRIILKAVLNKRSCPTILAGDFNCTPDEGTIVDIESCGMISSQKDQVTWYRMPLVLDHVFHSPEFRQLSCTVHDNEISDHMGVEVELEI